MNSTHKKKTAVILTAILLQAISGLAGGTLTGHVTDFASGAGIPGTRVEFFGSDQKIITNTLTDAVGYYEQSNLPAGSLMVHYTKGGFQPRPTKKAVEIGEGMKSQDVDLMNETRDDDAFVEMLALRIQTNAQRSAVAGLQAGYSQQWSFISDVEIAPELKARIANALKRNDPRVGEIQEIKPYLNVSPEKLKSATDVLDSPPGKTVPIEDLAAKHDIPESLKVDILRYNLNKAPKSQTEKKVYLDNVEGSFGKEVRDKLDTSKSIQ